MDDRIHRFLDGELRREELTPEELRQAAPYERVAHEAAEAQRGIECPDLTTVVMARLAAEAGVGAPDLVPESADGRRPWKWLEGAVDWLWTPRPIRIRPAWGALAAAAALVVTLLPGARFAVDGGTGIVAPPVADAETGTVASPTGEAGAAGAQVFVQFRFDAPRASDVRLAGSFTDWKPEYSLHRTEAGVWSILVPLAPGVHDYAFVVDEEEWVADPAAPRVDDGFGGMNSRLSVLLPETFSQS